METFGNDYNPIDCADTALIACADIYMETAAKEGRLTESHIYFDDDTQQIVGSTVVETETMVRIEKSSTGDYDIAAEFELPGEDETTGFMGYEHIRAVLPLYDDAIVNQSRHQTYSKKAEHKILNTDEGNQAMARLVLKINGVNEVTQQ